MRLIDADEIRKKAVPHTRGEHGYNANIRKWAVLVGDIDDAPTIDPATLRPHGRWVKRPNTKGQVYCSECASLETITDSSFKSNYCPNCGADMRKEK